SRGKTTWLGSTTSPCFGTADSDLLGLSTSRSPDPITFGDNHHDQTSSPRHRSDPSRVWLLSHRLRLLRVYGWLSSPARLSDPCRPRPDARLSGSRRGPGHLGSATSPRFPRRSGEATR